MTWLEPGDHVVFGFIPACGRCGPCSEGHSNLCDVGGTEFARGMQISDGTARHHTLDGKDLTLMCLLGTFAEHTVVNEASCVKIEKDWPLDKACLLGCGVVTGWGSAVYAADIKPGDFVAVVGVAVLAPTRFRVRSSQELVRLLRSIRWNSSVRWQWSSVRPIPMRRSQKPSRNLGESTWGRGFDKVIMTMGVGDGSVLGEAFWLSAKKSRTVVTNIHPTHEQSISIPGAFLTLFEKEIVGSLFGSANIRTDIPKLMELYTQGQLKLDELVTQTYTLDQINEGYEAMRNGENIRGVIIYD